MEQSTLLWRLPRLVRVVRQLRSNCGRLSQAQLCSRPPPPTWLSRRSRKHIFRGTEIVARLEGTEGTTGVGAVGSGAAAIRPGAAAFVPQSTSSLSTNMAAAPAFVPSALSPGLGSSIRPHLRRCCRRFVKAHARSPQTSSQGRRRSTYFVGKYRANRNSSTERCLCNNQALRPVVGKGFMLSRLKECNLHYCSLPINQHACTKLTFLRSTCASHRCSQMIRFMCLLC